jgi:outer membrane lipoprotein carrier protein
MKKIVLLLSSTLLLMPALMAQNDAKAKVILDGTSKKIKTYTSYKIEFTYKMENTTKKINEVKVGNIIVKGDKYRLEITGQTVICDGKTVWTYIKDANEVNIDNIKTDDDAINPTKLLNMYEKNFTYKLIKETTLNGKYVQIIDLKPIKGKKYFKVRLTIDKALLQIISSVVFDKNQTTTYTYLVTKFTPNIPVTDASFTFNKASYPGVEVNDMR